jgi:hypothetical protein
VRSAIPQHADPFFGGADLPALQVGLRLGALVGMLVANVVWFRRAERDPGARFLIGFQLMAVVPVVVAFAARAVGAWDFLLLQPLRVGPLLIPLLFFIALVGQAERRRDLEPVHQGWWRRGSTAVLLAGVLIALVVSSPTLAAPRMVARNYAAWTRDDPEADAFRWLADHTDARTRCVVSPDRQDAFMLGERAIVGNWQAIRYDALAEWRRRVGAQLDDPAILESPPVLLPDLAASYQRIPVDRMLTVARHYVADCVVSRARYPLPVLHRTGPVGIYQVPADTAP